MSHLIVKQNKTKSGISWRVASYSWNSDLKKYESKKLTPVVFNDLGFTKNMTAIQAKAHAKKLNTLDKLKRKDNQKKVNASENLYDLTTKSNELFPKELNEEFVDYIQDNWWGGEYNLRKTIMIFALVQRIMTKLNLLPNAYFKKKNSIYKHFVKAGYSPSYVEKIIKVINQWGDFYSEQNQSFFKKLPYPKGLILEQVKAHSKASGQGATPMTVKLLKQLLNMPDGQYEYAHASFYFGLRPVELDAIISDESSFKITTQSGISVLSINQSKLSGLDHNQRWKLIPIILPEQKVALKHIKDGIIKKPLVKTMKKYVPEHDKIGLYSGRKGFTDLMLGLGQSLENISAWLGHKNINRTWKHYKNKNVVSFDKLKKAD